jgi:hypothetical protein
MGREEVDVGGKRFIVMTVASGEIDDDINQSYPMLNQHLTLYLHVIGQDI